MDSILQILQGLGKSYFNVKGGSSPAIQVLYDLSLMRIPGSRCMFPLVLRKASVRQLLFDVACN
jgi:hypothetical protein